MRSDVKDCIQCPLDVWCGLVCCEINTNFQEQQWMLVLAFIYWREQIIKLPKFGTRAYLKDLKRMTKTLKWMTKTLICSADLNRFDQEFLFNPRNFDWAFPVIIWIWKSQGTHCKSTKLTWSKSWSWFSNPKLAFIDPLIGGIDK